MGAEQDRFQCGSSEEAAPSCDWCRKDLTDAVRVKFSAEHICAECWGAVLAAEEAAAACVRQERKTR